MSLLRPVLLLVSMITFSSASVSERPCDIYEAAGTPCVAAHSTVRAMYASYEGPLYQLRRKLDNKTKDIRVVPGSGFADASAQKAFCPPSTNCTIDIIYDQSPRMNHLLKVVVSAPNDHGWPINGINAMRDELTVGGHQTFSAYFEGGQDNIPHTTGVGTMGFRCNNKNGTAVDDEPESIYMVTSGTHFNEGCCFDYGNSEIRAHGTVSNKRNNNSDHDSVGAPGFMEAIYWGSAHGGADHPGSGDGPWVMADLEHGVWGGNKADVNPSNVALNGSEFIFAMVKGGGANTPGADNRWAIKGADAQTEPDQPAEVAGVSVQEKGTGGGGLKTLFDGPRPPGYNPMHKQGAIVLGIGGDNSDFGVGTFYEGAITANFTSDATDKAIYANIVAAGYGK